MRRTFNDLARMANVETSVIENTSGHLIDQTRERYATVTPGEQRESSVARPTAGRRAARSRGSKVSAESQHGTIVSAASRQSRVLRQLGDSFIERVCGRQGDNDGPRGAAIVHAKFALFSETDGGSTTLTSLRRSRDLVRLSCRPGDRAR